MEKTFQLEQKETVLLQQLDQERTQALAMVGALSLDMEQARKQLESSAERQRAFIRQALLNRGVDRYDNARTANGALLVTVPDAVMPLEGAMKLVERPNGPVIDLTKE